MEIINRTIEWLQGSVLIHSLVALILGSARALIEKSFNSSVGKKGLIIKVNKRRIKNFLEKNT